MNNFSIVRVGSCIACLMSLLIGCGGGSSDSSPAPVNPNTPVLYSTNLNWVAPVNRMDGSSLSFSEVAGYKVYMGQSRANLNLVKTIDDPQVFSTEITDITKGKYYFAIAVYDSDNLTSPLSKTIVREF
jgi:hypothetical protein